MEFWPLWLWSGILAQQLLNVKLLSFPVLHCLKWMSGFFLWKFWLLVKIPPHLPKNTNLSSILIVWEAIQQKDNSTTGVWTGHNDKKGLSKQSRAVPESSVCVWSDRKRTLAWDFSLHKLLFHFLYCILHVFSEKTKNIFQSYNENFDFLRLSLAIFSAPTNADSFHFRLISHRLPNILCTDCDMIA